MGLFTGSSTTKTNEKTDTGPSAFQSPYLTDAFNSAKDIYAGSKSSPYYQGQTYAGMSQEAKDTLAKLKGYASGTGLDTASTLSSLGTQMAGYGSKAASATDQFAAMAGQDPTQANITAATAYANNPAIAGMIGANSRDVTRNLSESVLPSIDRAASATGNINSSRAGVASGIAQRGAADRIGDISAQIRGDAYDRGLTLAQNDRSTNLSALSQAASSYGNLASFGVDALGKSSSAAYGAFDAINGANSAEQADRQGGLTADFSKWQGEDSRATDLLDRYAKIVAGGQWGQSGTSSGITKSTQAGSILGQLAGLASAGASIYTGLRKPKLG